MRASSPGLPTPGNGCSRTESIQLNTVLFTAMPKPSVSTATAVNQGLRRSIRNPNVTSFMIEGMAISGPATLNIRTCNSHSNRNSLQAHENCLATCPLVGPVCPEVARRVGQTSRSLRMGQRHTNRDENPVVGQALGLRRPLRPPGQAFHNLRWVFDCARVLQDPLLASRNQPSGHGRPTWTSAAGLVLPHAPPVSRLLALAVPARHTCANSASLYAPSALARMDVCSICDLARSEERR